MFHERTQITRNILVDPVEFLGQESVQWPPESSTSTAAPRSTPNGPIVVPSEINLFRQIAFVATVRRKKNIPIIPIIPYSSLNPVRIVASCVVIIFPHQTASGRRGGSPMVDPGHRQGTMKGPTAFTEPLLRSRRIFFSWWMAKGIMLPT